jgi:uncharacterized OB-fold protein
MERTLPPVTPLTAPWFDACREGRLTLQLCNHCERFQFYPRILCSHCGGQDLSWHAASGHGRIASFSVVRRAISAAWEAPYLVALIDLEEGPRMMSNIVDCDPQDVRIGHAVTVDFEAWSEAITLPVFRLQNRRN